MLRDRNVSGTTFARRPLTVVADAQRWTMHAADAADAVRLRSAFRAYLELHGDAESDFDAAEAVFGELVGNCTLHAPRNIRMEFGWQNRTLIVVEDEDRLRTWPFSAADMRAESTHHAFALISAFTDRIHLMRDPEGGTRASVVLPVTRGRHVPVVRGE